MRHRWLAWTPTYPTWGPHSCEILTPRVSVWAVGKWAASFVQCVQNVGRDCFSSSSLVQLQLVSVLMSTLELCLDFSSKNVNIKFMFGNSSLMQVRWWSDEWLMLKVIKVFIRLMKIRWILHYVIWTCKFKKLRLE